MSTHLTDDELIEVADDSDVAVELRAHLSSCPECTTTVTNLRRVKADLATVPTSSESKEASVQAALNAFDQEKRRDQQTHRSRDNLLTAAAIVALLFVVGVIGAGLLGNLATTVLNNAGSSLGDGGLGQNFSGDGVDVQSDPGDVAAERTDKDDTDSRQAKRITIASSSAELGTFSEIAALAQALQDNKAKLAQTNEVSDGVHECVSREVADAIKGIGTGTWTAGSTETDAYFLIVDRPDVPTVVVDASSCAVIAQG